jgi:predicted sulfurtransferase
VTQSILKKFPIIQYDCQRTPKSSFDGYVDSFEEKACVETHDTRNHNHTCPICTDDFVQYQLLRVLPCGHQYHMKCIEDWLARGSNCPVWYVSS